MDCNITVKSVQKLVLKNPQRNNPEKTRMKLKEKIFKILENNEKCCVNFHYCIPCGIEGGWTYVAKCDAVNKFKGTRAISSLMRKYKGSGKYPFAYTCFHYYGGP